jgi:hypothetical protein
LPAVTSAWLPISRSVVSPRAAAVMNSDVSAPWRVICCEAVPSSTEL